MSEHRASTPVRRRVSIRSSRLRAALSLGVVMGLGAIATGAYWSDQATVSGGTFTTGTLDIKVGTPAVDNDPPQFTTDFAMADMVPGSTKDAVLAVRNAGSVAFTYTISASATNSGAGTDQLGSAIRISTFAGTCGGTQLQSGVAPSAVSVSRPALATSALENLCFRATLPTGADTALQGKQSLVTITLNATQVP